MEVFLWDSTPILCFYAYLSLKLPVPVFGSWASWSPSWILPLVEPRLGLVCPQLGPLRDTGLCTHLPQAMSARFSFPSSQRPCEARVGWGRGELDPRVRTAHFPQQLDAVPVTHS